MRQRTTTKDPTNEPTRVGSLLESFFLALFSLDVDSAKSLKIVAFDVVFVMAGVIVEILSRTFFVESEKVKEKTVKQKIKWNQPTFWLNQ